MSSLCHYILKMHTLTRCLDTFSEGKMLETLQLSSYSDALTHLHLQADPSSQSRHNHLHIETVMDD